MNGKRVKEVYEKKNLREHILFRTDTYVGSIAPEKRRMWVWDAADDPLASRGAPPGKLVFREIELVPGLYKIFDEILVNAADNKQRDPSMSVLKVSIDSKTGEISVYNNGRGIPVEVHGEHGKYIPELIFGHLLTSSNYDDSQKKTTGGRNGLGAKLANIFSTHFTVETFDGKHKYKQVFSDNMTVIGRPSVRSHTSKAKFASTRSQWTRITFLPEYKRFGFKDGALTKDMIALMSRRVVDLAGCMGAGVTVRLNGSLIKSGFKPYVQLYADAVASAGSPSAKFAYYRPTEQDDPGAKGRWEIAAMAAPADDEAYGTGTRALHHTSFVNAIYTSNGGTHVSHVADPLARMIAARIGGGGGQVKPYQVKQRLWVFVRCLVENPAFDTQTKQTLTTHARTFGSKCTIHAKCKTAKSFVDAIVRNTGIRERVEADSAAKQGAALKKTDGRARAGRITGVPKLRDANKAGTRKRREPATLILTEGDSAAALALAGLSVVGRDFYGVFPLKGKLLNVRDASAKQILNNAEVSNLKKIIGLQQGREYKTTEDLRYDRVMIMADQDHDGSHIKGLVINLFSHFWPSLFRMPGFLVEFVTPIVKCTRGTSAEKQFFTLPEYRAWEQKERGRSGASSEFPWRVKYYKGLGTSTPKEAKHYFRNLDRHVIAFRYEDPRDDRSIDLAFSKKLADQRKAWLADLKEGTFLEQGEADSIRYKDFVDHELILFSRASNERAIPSAMDGLKPGQRKILYACFKRNLKASGPSIKVAQLAGYVSEHAAYHHGEASLNSTIVKMAQDYVGSNNINLLEPDGQFGTREDGGKDAASPRYIFTKLAAATRLIFRPEDDAVLDYRTEDGQAVEPLHYAPIIPMVLVNGASGMGTGWSTAVPNHDPLEVIANVRRYLAAVTDQQQPPDFSPMAPAYRGFTGEVRAKATSAQAGGSGAAQPGSPAVPPPTVVTQYEMRGVASAIGASPSSYKVMDITELPVGVWTLKFKKDVLDPLLDKGSLIKGYRELHKDGRVHFQVNFKEPQPLPVSTAAFKLTKTVHMSNMNLFDARGRLHKYASSLDILRAFCEARIKLYSKRKAHLVGRMRAASTKAEMRARFIQAVCETDETKRFMIQNRTEGELVQALEDQGYVKECDMDPSPAAAGLTYEYLVDMPMRSLTRNRVVKLQKKIRDLHQSLESLERTSARDLWENDLSELEAYLKSRPSLPTGAVLPCRKRKKVKRGSIGSTRETKRIKQESVSQI